MFALVGLVLNFIIIGILIYYVLTSLLLHFYHKRAYGKGTPLAWIPLFRLYLFGKFAFSESLGVVLLFAFFFFNIEFEIPLGHGSVMKYPPFEIPYASTVTFAFLIACIVITIINYFKLRKGIIPTTLQKERNEKERKEQEKINNTENPIKITSENMVNEIKSTELYDASLSHIQSIEYNKVSEQSNENEQVEKINCPNCGTLIKKEIVMCPFCGKQIK